MKFTRDFYIDSRLDCKIELENFLILFTENAEDRQSRFVAQFFKGKEAKSIDYLFFKTKEKMIEKIEQYKEWNKRILQEKIDRKEKRKKDLQAFKDFLKVGSILTDSWGYEQTNVEFYKVISINDKKTEMTIRELLHKTVDGSEVSHGMACDVLPGENFAGDEVKVKIRTDGIKICSSIFLTPWDGRKKYKSWYY